MALFQHEDDDGDALEVSGTEETEYDPRYHMLFTVTRSSGRASSCALDMEALKRLHSLIGEWLYPHHRAEEPNLTLIEKMVAKAVKEQVSAVLPLHLSPVTIVGEHPDCGCTTVKHPPEVPLCNLEDCSLFAGVHFEHDPEPVICKRCGARPEGDHPDCGGEDRRCVYIGPDHDDYDLALKASIQAKATGPADPEPKDVGHPEEPRHGRLMADLPRRKPKLTGTWDDRLFQGVTPFCDECDHVWSRHSVALRKCNVRVNGVHCGCNVLERRHS